MALALFGASAAEAADQPLLTSALALCRANHSRAADVLAAAERDGWMRLPKGRDPFDQYRWKLVDGKRQTLAVMRMAMTLETGVKAVGYHCQVVGEAPIGELTQAVRALMGRAPTDDFGQVSVNADWVFTERDGRREFLSAGSGAPVAAALKTGPVEFVLVSKFGQWVAFDEMVAAAP